MTNRGRPLRFLLLVTGGWIGLRTMMLWPATTVAAATGTLAPIPAPTPAAATVPVTPQVSIDTVNTPVWKRPASAPRADRPPPAARLPSSPSAPSVVSPAERATIIPGLPARLPPADPALARLGRSRFFGSAWVLARGGSGPAGGVPGVQLGGSQAGVRLAYALRDDRRIALAARLSSPLGRGMREAALGLEWQPTRLPVRIVAEQRVALGRGRGGPTLAAVGGVGPMGIAAGFRLEAYAQAGVIARDGAEGFGDGAVRVARPLGMPGGIRIDLGAGAWGAAQRGARRLDVGPSLSATLPVGPQPVRLSLDWRQRVGGNAAPGSGLVVTLGADF